MSSDNHRAYVAIPMDMFGSNDETSDVGAPSRCRSLWTSRNFLLPKCLGVAAPCIFALILIMVRIAHHHPHEKYGWDEVAHDKMTYSEEVFVMQNYEAAGSLEDLPVYDDTLFEEDEKWHVDKDGWLVDELRNKPDIVVFDGEPQKDDSIGSIEEDTEAEVWDAEDVTEKQDVFYEVDEPLEFFAREDEDSVNVLDEFVELPGMP
jgi:hypothetical protein